MTGLSKSSVKKRPQPQAHDKQKQNWRSRISVIKACKDWKGLSKEQGEIIPGSVNRAGKRHGSGENL